MTLPLPRASLRIYGRNGFVVPSVNDSQPIREFYIRIGPLRHGSHCVKIQQDPVNWIRGVRKRVAHIQNFDQHEQQQFFNFVRDEILPRFPVIEPGLSDEYLLENWLAKSNYNSKRKNKLRELNAIMQTNFRNNPRVFQCKSFIKAEFYPEVKEARIINSRSDYFKSFIGGIISLIQERVMKEHFVKHLTPDQIAQKLDEVSHDYSFVYETDYSSFEGSFTKTFMLNVEYALFKHMLVNYPKYSDYLLVCYNSNNTINYRNILTATFEGSRMSGDMWTSLANGFSNYCLVEWYMHKHSQRIGPFMYDFLVEGDDGFIATGVDLPFIQEDARLLGFTLKCDKHTSKNDLSFCGICEYEGKLVPDINRYLSHYGLCCDQTIVRCFSSKTKRSQKHLKDWIHSKALSLLAVSRGIPVLQAVAQQQLSLGGRFNPRYVDWWESQFYNFHDLTQMKAEPITIGMRKFVEQRFGIPIDLQFRIERDLKHCRHLCYDIYY